MAHVLAKVLREAVLNDAIKGDLSNTLESDTKIENTISQLMTNKKGYKWEKGKKKITINSITDKDCEAFSTRYTLVRLGNIVSILGRIGFRGFVKEDFVEKSNFICLNPGNLLPANKMSYSKLSYIREEKYAESPEIQIENGDILMVKTGSSYGKCAIIENLNVQATINPQLVRIVSHGVNKKYLLYVFASKIGKDQFEDFVTGTATPTFSQEKLSNFLVPFPPIEEQARIVARVDELMAKIDEYEKLENELVELKKNFPGDMKAAVLQAAMQGKLTEQLMSDGEVNRELLSTKNYPKIEELYDLPDNWINAHLEDLTNSIATKQYQILESDVCKEGKYPVISQSKEYSIGFSNDEERVFIPTSKIVLFGDHTTTVKTIDYPFVVGADGVKLFECNNPILPEYLYYVLIFNASLISEVGGYSRHYKYLKNKSIPLPPIEEQRRVVEKLDKILPLCEELEKEVI